MLKRTLQTLIQTVAASAVLFFIITLLTIIIDSFILGRFSPRHIFRVNFFAATIIMFAGVAVEFFPVILPKSKLLDHTTHGEFFVEKRQEKRKAAHKLIYLGICTIFVTASFQFVLSLII